MNPNAMSPFERAAVNIASAYRYLQELAATLRAPYGHRILLEFDRDHRAWALHWDLMPLREDGPMLHYRRFFPELELGHITDTTAYVIAAGEEIFETVRRTLAHFEDECCCGRRFEIGIIHFRACDEGTCDG